MLVVISGKQDNDQHFHPWLRRSHNGEWEHWCYVLFLMTIYQ